MLEEEDFVGSAESGSGAAGPATDSVVVFVAAPAVSMTVVGSGWCPEDFSGFAAMFVGSRLAGWLGAALGMVVMEGDEVVVGLPTLNEGGKLMIIELEVDEKQD